MSGFDFFSSDQSIKALKLKSRAEEVPLAVARKLAPFRLPVSLYDKWLRLPGNPPDAKWVSPAWLGAELLPLMYIVETVGDGDDFRWRLFGTRHTASYGAEATGMMMSEAAKIDTSARDSLAFAKQVYKSGEPCFYLTEFLGAAGIVKSSATVILPLADDSGNISRLFGCSAWR